MKLKKIFMSIMAIILVFLCFSSTCFAETEYKSCVDIVKEEKGGFFEEIIAKMLAGIADTVFDVTTLPDFNVGFKDYDQLIFGIGQDDIEPFTSSQWLVIRMWYLKMTIIAGIIILIAVIITSYRIILAGFNGEKRTEAKDALLRLAYGAVAIVFAPLFVRFLLFLNNSLVRVLMKSTFIGSLDSHIGRAYLGQISTGNAIATAIVISMFAYLFFKLNVKFIIRQFTILVFTVFTPIIATLWIINKRTIGAAIWFGQIFINVFMQFIYCFLFLIYLSFVPSTSGWAVSLLWAMMILPLRRCITKYIAKFS